MMRLRLVFSPSLSSLKRSSSVRRRPLIAISAAAAASLPLLGDLAGGAVVVGGEERVTAPGTAVRPSTSTGWDGTARSIGRMLSSSIARTRP
jgi:hypothetical protein